MQECGARAVCFCKSVLAGLLAGLLLLASFGAISPALHHLLHEDESNWDLHECVITMLAQHQVLCGAVQPVLVIESEGVFLGTQACHTSQLVVSDYQLPSSRGPPKIFIS